MKSKRASWLMYKTLQASWRGVGISKNLVESRLYDWHNLPPPIVENGVNLYSKKWWGPVHTSQNIPTALHGVVTYVCTRYVLLQKANVPAYYDLCYCLDFFSAMLMCLGSFAIFLRSLPIIGYDVKLTYVNWISKSRLKKRCFLLKSSHKPRLLERDGL